MNGTEKKESLQRSTVAYVCWHIFRSNVRDAFRNIWVVAGAIICLLIAAVGSVYTFRNPYNIVLTRVLSMVAIWELFFCVLVWLVLSYGHLHRALKQANNFIRAGCVNRAGEPPLLTNMKRVNKEESEYTFFCRGLSLDDWNDLKSRIESALNIIVIGFKEGANKQYIDVRCISGNRTLPTVAEWSGLPDSTKEEEILIGQGYIGPVSINLAKIPHWLVGGSTGCGKSRLLAGMMFQMLLKGYSVYLIDVKDGMDYGFARPHTKILKEADEIVELLENVMTAMDDRREVLKRAEVHDISEYNDKYPQYHMRRICLVIDEASCMFDSQSASKEEKEKIGKITRYVTQIGRLARFVGIHLIIATQRCDVNSVPGAVKANLAGRIAGHCADDQASITILDDGSATEIPMIAGRFLVRDGGLNNNMVQAYLLDEEKIDVELRRHFLKNTVEVH